MFHVLIFDHVCLQLGHLCLDVSDLLFELTDALILGFNDAFYLTTIVAEEA